jgi:multidrug efflux pump subunit AcrA (membrane-fusion protein)
MNLPDVKASVDQAEVNYRAAESAYAAAKTQFEAPVREAERALSEARAAEKAARVALQSGGSADLQAATEARIQAEAAVQAAKASVNSQILGEKQQLDYAAEYLKDARAGAKFANIKSPITGTVMSLDVKPGQVVKTKEALATIVDLAAIRIQGVVPPEWKDKVVKGTQILISMEGTNSDPFPGEVKEVSVLPPSEGQASPGYLAVIDFNNEKGLVLPGSQVKRLGLKTGEAKDVLVVPVAAVQKNKDGKSVVYIQNGSNWAETMVETGLTDGALIEIKSGVKEGDVVKLS